MSKQKIDFIYAIIIGVKFLPALIFNCNAISDLKKIFHITLLYIADLTIVC